MLTATALCVLLAIGAAQDQEQPKSLLQQLVPKPTGINGYEEYLMAADMLKSPELSQFHAWVQYKNLARDKEPWTDPDTGEPLSVPPAPRGLDLQSTLLELRRYQVKLAPRVFDLVSKGNRKSVSIPQKDIDLDTVFPELASFKEIARHLVAEAHVLAAAGNPRSASERLQAALQMSGKVSRGTLIHLLVGNACTAVSLAGYDLFLPQFGLNDLKNVERLAGEQLADTTAIQVALDFEAEFSAKALDSMVSPPAGKEDEAGLMFTSKDQADVFMKMPLATRKSIVAAAKGKIHAYCQRLTDLLKQPEAQWVRPGVDISSSDRDWEEELPRTSDEVVALLVDTLTPMYAQALSSICRLRTQIRLLHMHSRVRQFWWENRRLPKDLAECVSEKEIKDPVSGSNYLYAKLNENTYTLSSVGFANTGPIELVYRQPKRIGAPEEGDPPPPPFAAPAACKVSGPQSSLDLVFGVRPLTLDGSVQVRGPLSRKYAPNPTGMNAMEEYLAAADMVTGSAWDDLVRWEQYSAAIRQRRTWTGPDGTALPTPTQPEGLAPGCSRLDILRYQTRLAPRLLDTVIAGNRKQMSLASKGLTDPGHELMAIREPARKLVDEAFVMGSEARPYEVSRRLIACLDFAQNVCPSSLGAWFTGRSISSIAMPGYDSLLSKLGLNELKETEAKARAMLAANDAFSLALKVDRQNFSKDLEVMTQPDLWTVDDDIGPFGLAAQRDSIAKLPVGMIAEARKLAVENVGRGVDAILTRLQAPEKTWFEGAETNDAAWSAHPPSSAEALARMLSEYVLYTCHRLVLAHVTNRQRLRLLILHCRVLIYRWHHGKLPAMLEECAEAKDSLDPLTGAPFKYSRLTSQAFRVYSVGVPGYPEYHLIQRATDSPVFGAPPPQ